MTLYKKDVRVVSPETYRLLRRYPWPGNVRELKNVIQRAVLLAKSSELTPDLLPSRIRESAGSSAAEAPSRSPIPSRNGPRRYRERIYKNDARFR
jgi:DNA-binding NtrC family response regulator